MKFEKKFENLKENADNFETQVMERISSYSDSNEAPIKDLVQKSFDYFKNQIFELEKLIKALNDKIIDRDLKIKHLQVKLILI